MQRGHRFHPRWGKFHMLGGAAENKQINLKKKKNDVKEGIGTFLVVQWLKIYLPKQRVQVQSLVMELRSHMPSSQRNKT